MSVSAELGYAHTHGMRPKPEPQPQSDLAVLKQWVCQYWVCVHHSGLSGIFPRTTISSCSRSQTGGLFSSRAKDVELNAPECSCVPWTHCHAYYLVS
jgi:hypothetical protein